MRITVCLVAFVLSSFIDLGMARSKTEVAKPDKVIRAGGLYKVSNISKNPNGIFTIEFVNESPGRYAKLIFESLHVHMSVAEGQKVRLSAEILVDHGDVAEVSQVLLFLPVQGGEIPVWMLSHKNGTRDLRGARYLEMHVPDYLIL